MRIMYFRLKGYAGIFQGMGLDEITIPFSEFKNRFIIIRGDNGCGKSTILKALSVQIDGSEYYRTDDIFQNGERVLIEHPAEKEIHLQDGKDLYKILIVSSINNNGTRGVTKAYIKKNEVDLNPNGNVSSYKELVDSSFNIDPSFIALSMVSSENRGIVDMTPYDRKKFMSSIIDSVAFYNDCYKKISKEASISKSNMSQLQAKIYNIGDENNLHLRLQQLLSQSKSLQSRKDEIIKSIAEKNTFVKMSDPDGTIQALYTSIIEQLRSIKTSFERFTQNSVRILREYKLEPEKDYLKEIEILKESISNANIEIEKNKALLSNYSSLLSDEKLNNEKLVIEQNNLESESVQENIGNVLDNTRSVQRELKKKLNTSILTDDIEYSMVNNINNICESVEESLHVLLDYHTASDIYHAFHITQKEIEDTLVSSNRELEDLQNKKQNLSSEYDKYSNMVEEIKALSNRPKGCKFDNCYFIKNLVDMKSLNPEKKLEEIQVQLDRVNTDIKEAKEDITHFTEYQKIYLDADKTIFYPISQIKYEANNPIILKILKSLNSIKDSDPTYFRLSYKEEIHTLMEQLDIKSQIESNETKIKNLEADYRIYQNHISMVKDIEEKLSTSNSKIEELDKKIQSINHQLVFSRGVIDDANSRIEKYQEWIDNQNKLQELNDQKAKLKEQYDSTKDKIQSVKSSVDEIQKLQDEQESVEKQLSPIQEEIDRTKFAIANLISYQQDLKSTTEEFDKLNFLKQACNPTRGGIQSIYMTIYMDKIFQICNQLLSYLFNGELQIMKPVITDNSFNIPFISREGIPIADVGMGSTSQKCMIAMIFSFAVLSQSSGQYNIPRLDEIDGGLDTNNRMKFAEVLMKLMDIMNVEQCIMISHNLEIDAYSADIINVSPNGLSFGHTGNGV